MKNFRPRSRPKKSSLIVGRTAIKEAVESGQAIEKIYLQQNIVENQLNEIVAVAHKYKIPINRVPEAKLNSFNVSPHDGCIAVISKIQYYDLQAIISFVVENGRVPLFLILDGITDIRNIGAIARTAYCTGVHAIIIPDKGVGALNEDAILTSAGALEKIAVCRVVSLMKAVDELHANGVKVFASEMTAERNVFDLNLREPSAIVLGSEEKGIYPALMKICDEQFKIPMITEFESLNVSVAAGMILYETMKQRGFHD